MKNKRLFQLLFLTIVSYSACSQNTNFGLSIGMNASKCYSAFYGFSYSQEAYTNTGTGFAIGYYAKVPLKKHLIFQPVFSYIKKKASDYSTTFNSYTNSTTYLSSSVSADIAELTLNYLYHPADKNGFFIGTGPSFSLGIYKNNMSYKNLDFSYNNSSSSPLPSLAVNLVGGYEFSRQLAISTNYNIELQSQHRFEYFGLNLQYTFK